MEKELLEETNSVYHPISEVGNEAISRSEER